MLEGQWQNISPQNLLLWHKDYFELKAIELKEKLSILPYLPETGHKSVKVSPSPLSSRKDRS